MVHAAALIDRPSGRQAAGPPYAELHCHSAFSFLDGASPPDEILAAAHRLGYPAIALTDRNGIYGSLAFAHAAQPLGIQAITGAAVTLTDGSQLILLAETPQGYANLCRLLTETHLGADRLEPVRAEVRLRQQAAEVRVPLRRFRQQNQLRAVRECDCGAGDRLDAEGLRRMRECERAIDPVAIGERDGGIPQPVRRGEDLVGRRGSVQEGERGVAMKLRIGRAGGLTA